MEKAQEFLINHLKATGDSYDTIEEKSGVSKSTISRMFSGHTVSSSSMRFIADAYNLTDEFLAVVSASADPNRAARELHEMYKHQEQLISDNCEERLHAMKNLMAAQDKAHAKELDVLLAADKRIIDTLEKSVNSEKALARTFLRLCIVFGSLFLITLAFLAYYLGYDLTHHEIGLFK